MRTDLPVDLFEAALSVSDLLAETGSKFREEVAVFSSSGFGVKIQLGNFAGEQSVPLGIEVSNVALGMLNLACYAEKLCGVAFTGDGGVDLAVIIQQGLQSFDVAAAVGLIGAGHQQGEMFLLGVVARKIRMDAFGDVTEEGLERGWWVKLFGCMGIAECCVVRFLRSLAGFLCSLAGGFGVVEINLAFGDASLEFIEFRVENTDLTEITTFESLELGADLGELRLALDEQGANSGKLLALVEEVRGVRGWLKSDFDWHVASQRERF
jgi:hypothetical protein